MRRSTTAGVGLVLGVASVASLLAQSPASPQQPQVFRSDAHFVLVDAYPIREGRVVEGLAAADFTIREDGVEQKVELFEYIDGGAAQPESARRDPNTVAESRAAVADPRARAFVAYLDLDHVSTPGAHRMRVPLVEFLNRVITPNDVFGVISTAHEPETVTFARRVTSAEDQLARYWAWGRRDTFIQTDDESGLWACFGTNDSAQVRWVWDGNRERPLDEVLVDRYRTDRAIEHLEDTVRYLGHLREGRTSVLLVSEGWRQFVPDSALKSEVERTSNERPSVVKQGSEMMMFNRLDQGQRQACIMEAVRLADLDVRTRYMELIRLANSMNVSFFAVNPLGLPATDSSLGDRIRGIRGSGLVADDFARLRERRESLMAVAENTDGAAVVDNNDLRASMEPVIEQLRSFYLLGYYSTNRKFDGGLRRIEVASSAPGVAVKARRSYRAPTEEERAARANPVAAPELSTLEKVMDVLASTRAGAEGGAGVARYLKADAEPILGAPKVFRATPSPRSPILEATSFAFRRTERLRAEWPISGGEPLTSRTARVVGRDGTPRAVQVALSERADGGLVLVIDAILAPLAPGDYAIEVEVSARGETRRTYVPFKVVP